jgi:hypothetical protein
MIWERQVELTGWREKYLNQISEDLVRPKHREKEGRATKNLKVTGVYVLGGGGCMA